MSSQVVISSREDGTYLISDGQGKEISNVISVYIDASKAYLTVLPPILHVEMDAEFQWQFIGTEYTVEQLISLRDNLNERIEERENV